MLRQAGDIPYASSPLLESVKFLRHAFCTRVGGVSKSLSSSLNFDLRDGDVLQHINQNKTLAGNIFSFDPAQLLTINQVHGTDVFVIDKPIQSLSGLSQTAADAIVTNQPGLAIGVLTADCVPVMLADPAQKVIAVVHAGWKGTVNGIVQKAVEIMVKRFGSAPETMAAAVGPSIGQCCYTVDQTVTKLFREKFSQAHEFIKEEKNAWKIDLKRANRIQLLSEGILEKNISIEDFCTSCRHDLFFSYRADKKVTGRQLNFIMLREK